MKSRISLRGSQRGSGSGESEEDSSDGKSPKEEVEDLPQVRDSKNSLRSGDTEMVYTNP